MTPRSSSGSAGAEHEHAPRRLSLAAKLGLAALVWWDFVIVAVGLRREPLARLVQALADDTRVRLPRLRPERLGRIVHRVLHVGPYRPRCLLLSLVLFRLLRRQGTRGELVIGLAPDATSHEAHAWVEVRGEDVGPPPGRMGHSEMVRYGG